MDLLDWDFKINGQNLPERCIFQINQAGIAHGLLKITGGEHDAPSTSRSLCPRRLNHSGRNVGFGASCVLTSNNFSNTQLMHYPRNHQNAENSMRHT
jgi:hypothetical protein